MAAKEIEEHVLLANGKTVVVSTKPTEQPREDEEEKAQIERVHNVWGSSSGARSDFFDIYCKHRNTENERLEELEKNWKQDMENKVFQAIRFSRMQKEQQKTLKRREKRAKRKMKNKNKNANEQQGAEEQGTDSDSEADEDAPKRHKTASGPHKVARGPAGAQDSTAAGKNNEGPGGRLHTEHATKTQKSAKLVIHDDLADTF